MTGPLEALRDHARTMAEDATTTDSEAALWTAIAEEIDDWLDGATPQEPQLF
jgi:hypothetical protein